MNIIEDIMKHQDMEIIEHLSKTMSGVMKNYNTSLEAKTPEVLWGNLGDVVMVAQVLKAMDKRNKDRLAQAQEA